MWFGWLLQLDLPALLAVQQLVVFVYVFLIFFICICICIQVCGFAAVPALLMRQLIVQHSRTPPVGVFVFVSVFLLIECVGLLQCRLSWRGS